MRKHLKKFLPDHEVVRNNRWLKPFEARLLHPRLWHLNRHSAAGAVAAGLFCGLIPGPFQMLGAAICAVAFRVNLALALFTTLYTNPFTIVPLYVVAYEIGRFVTADSGGFVAPPDFDGSHLANWTRAMVAWMIGIGRPLGIGLVVLAAALAVAGYVAVKAAWRIYLIRAWRRRHQRH
ncbi:MAG TPA: DUF2062 domain-containing protein [Rhodocyclaceae bacterium]|nr:DUF2062 domain-containing protein [Rhodocyclaceae bacterium]